jgi:hypothetical protein
MMEEFEMRGNTLGIEATIPIAVALESQSHLKVFILLNNHNQFK